MDNDKKDKETPVPQQFPPAEPPTKMDAYKKNPNPRANENLPQGEPEKEGEQDREGPGSEVTDGEDG